jgi:hypothetical protein
MSKSLLLASGMISATLTNVCIFWYSGRNSLSSRATTLACKP